ncbi:hypothetical protein Hanom_Chr00s008523g01741211 [Helianthus anomalus]
MLINHRRIQTIRNPNLRLKITLLRKISSECRFTGAKFAQKDARIGSRISDSCNPSAVLPPNTFVAFGCGFCLVC